MIPAIAYTITILAVLLGWLVQFREREKDFKQERESWHQERADLLNRIQAGNYAEYKTQEIRLIKAQNDDKKPNTIEPL